MAIQTAYNQELTKGIAGQKTGIGPFRTVTRVAATGVEFGAGVQRTPAAADELVKVPDNAAHAFVGVTCFSHAVNTDATLLADEDVEAGQALSVLREGRIWARIDSDVDEDAAVFLVINSAGGDTPGHFRATADAANTVEITAGAKWDGTFTTAGDTVGILELNLPQ